ncbi:unnamed protein product [Caenorhabditis brenneri]
MPADALTLLQMPEVIMGHIFDNLNLPDILILRKTCHHLRNLIDDLHADPKIVSTQIVAGKDSIEFDIYLDKNYDCYPAGKVLRIEYGLVKDVPDAYTVQWFRSDGSRKARFEGNDFIAHFCRDFEFIFGGHSLFDFHKNPKNPSKIEKFLLNLQCFPQGHVHWDAITRQLLSSMKSTLKNRPRPLPVKEFYSVVYDKSHVLQVLQFLEPKTLEKIQIIYCKSRAFWDLKGFPKLEQWKRCKVLCIRDVILEAKIQELIHFEDIKIELGKVMVEDLLEMKESILNSTSNLTSGRIECLARDGEEHFLQTYGFPFTDLDQAGDERKSWFFKIPNKKSVLRISFYFMFLEFEVLEDPPKNALVH